MYGGAWLKSLIRAGAFDDACPLTQDGTGASSAKQPALRPRAAGVRSRRLPVHAVDGFMWEQRGDAIA
ncbi:protein of unknown function [Methylococcus capsulatus]|uniref:Uncharacterized protein n=1 Tax=Methylococcus capsulatus TaxID=414 RepID=A0AA35Y053_METCP|nr:protein of unknown function [Methylococcus capsulatus]